MRLTVVGCAGLFPSPSSAASSYLVECPGSVPDRPQRLLVDLGSGALGPLQRIVPPAELDAVLLSNLDPDHCADLSTLYVMLRYAPSGPVRIPIWGPAGTLSRLVDLTGLESPEEIRSVFEIFEWAAESPVTVGTLTITPYRVNHQGDSFGLRVTDDSSVLAYTGDTSICPALLALADRADLLLAAATLPERRAGLRGSHLTGGLAGTVAANASARRLILTHLPVWTDSQHVLAAAAGSYRGPLEIAQPGRTYEL